MRFQTIFTAAVIGACAIAVLGAPALALNQGNAYQTLSLSSAEACTRACEDDSLCIAWTYSTTGACNLSAVAPQQTPSEMKYGLSTRAPSFARAQAEMRGSTPEQPAVADAAPPAQEPPAVRTEARASGEMSFEEASLALLGGPEDDTLRPRLGRQ